MEVHHHPHVEKKNFKEYFLEFLMIFLAVTLGFIAENIREHSADRSKEKEFMASIVRDLKSDTATYAAYAKNNDDIYAMVDSLVPLMKNPGMDAHLNKIYFLARMITIKLRLHFPNKSTYEQMKSSGQLRLIENREAADSIGAYYNSLEIINSFNDVILSHDYDYMRIMGKVFDAGTLLSILKEKKEPLTTPALLTKDPAVINELLTSAQYIYGSLLLIQSITTQRQHSAENLITLINSKYHF
ncbi:MAG TPA: hypothetical protein VGI61_01350 [Parafilimonas sp.]|jgi:hypothetical protein